MQLQAGGLCAPAPIVFQWLERHHHALLKIWNASALHMAHMHENIAPALIGRHKAKTFVLIKKLDDTTFTHGAFMAKPLRPRNSAIVIATSQVKRQITTADRKVQT